MNAEPEWLKNHVPAPPPQRWKAGQSGNPKGRPVGSVNKRTELAQAFHDEGKAVAEVVIAAAKKGDLQACGLVLARLAPPLRASAQKVRFEFDPSASLTGQAQSVLVAIAGGEVDPDIGKTLIDAISALGGLRQVDEHAERLAQIEAQLQSRRHA